MYDEGMKISKISIKKLIPIFACVLTSFFISCKSSNTPAPVVEEPVAEEVAPVVEEPKIEETAPLVEEKVPEPVSEEPSPVQEEPAVENQEEPAPTPEDDEYTRSVGAVAVDRNTFADDKEKVLKIISELDEIMKNMNYNAWVPYVEPASVDYWKLRKNLQKYEKRLPVKGIKLTDLQAYFKHVFVPARKGREVSEIRYISDTYIKAVQVREGQEDIIYYYFNKINGKWMVHLPTNEELN